METFLNITEAGLLIPFLYQINQVIFKKLKERHSFFSFKKMNILFFYHLLFGATYYIYAYFNNSDSHRYFSRPAGTIHSWFNFFGLETRFIDFISYPFIKGLGFSYEMIMLLFTYIGFWGFVFAYLFFKENIKQKIIVFKRIDLLTLILFLPNMHFWTASLGKGAPIFLGLMLFAYSFKYPKERFAGLFIGSILIFCIRPHIFLLVALGAVVGIMTGQEKISFRKKLAIFSILFLGFFLIKDQVLGVMNLEHSTNLWTDFLKFAQHRSNDLSTSGSGVNMVNYSFPEKIFTFWFRPLFYDAPGVLGVIVSIENLIYLLLFIKLLKKEFFTYIWKASKNVKMSLVLFLTTSLAMTFIMSNLGIIIREKSMVMYFMFYVIYCYLDHEQRKATIPNRKNFIFQRDFISKAA